MNAPRHARRWVAAGAVALMVAVVPVSAGAAGLADEPSPPSWPTVAPPTDSSGRSDPQPVTRPTVEIAETAQGSDPRPTTWPTPEQQ
ncbi:hypothetical protein [Kribbella sp. DT2]|uniref:hypothetical protein n=1 Tax=Kribbella sp. DT2 TaxID=3393427 RepID=UPI003CF4729C